MNLDDGPNMTWLQTEANIAGFDIPIFTEEFVEHSRARGNELRQLRKDVGELERQNEAAGKNANNMRNSLASAEAEARHLAAQNAEMLKNLNTARHTLLSCFKNAGNPNPTTSIEIDNLDEHVFKMNSLIKQHRQQPNSLTDIDSINALNYYLHVKSIISKVNFTPFFG